MSEIQGHLPYHGLPSEEHLREIGDELPDGLFTIDREGIVTFWNKAAERITGWTREEAIGKHCASVAGDAVNGCTCGAGAARCAEIGSRSAKRCAIRTKDGRLLVIVKHAVPLITAEGHHVGSMESFVDVGLADLDPHHHPGLPGGDAGDFQGFVGADPAMLELYRMIGLVARARSTVMVVGESGVGKSLVAEAIHRLGTRAEGPFVRVSCATPEGCSLEEELFGHVAFTPEGVREERAGRVEEADGGTLLLDEIGDLAPAVQLKLLRLVEEHLAERHGDAEPRPLDLRIICTSNRDLKRAVAEGLFRADLFFRLNVFPLRVPPLREHLQDLPRLAERLLARLPGDPMARPRLTPEALRVLAGWSWPGNVRELINVLEFAALRAEDGVIGPEQLPDELRHPAAQPSRTSLPMAGRDERKELVDLLERCGWNRTRAAKELGISRVTLWKRLKRHGIHEPPPPHQAH